MYFKLRDSQFWETVRASFATSEPSRVEISSLENILIFHTDRKYFDL